MELPLSKASTYERGYEYAWVRLEPTYVKRIKNEGQDRIAENMLGLLPTFQDYEFAGIDFTGDPSNPSTLWARVKIKRGYETLGAFITQHEECAKQDTTKFSVLYEDDCIQAWCECGDKCVVEKSSLHKEFVHQT